MRAILYDNGISIVEAAQVPEKCLGLVVSFSSFGENNPDQLGFGQRFLEKNGYAVVAVKKRIDNWYRDLPPEDLAEVVLARYGDLPGCFTYGASMGGYAALYFSGSLGANAIAISPRNSVDPRFAIPSYAAYVKNWPTAHPPLTTVADAASKPYIVYDPLVKSDKDYIEREIHPAFPQGRYVEFPFSGHPSAQAMSEIGQLKTFVLNAFSGSAVSGHITSAGYKKHSTVIINEMSKWALRRNRLELGTKLSEMACALGGERVDLLYQRGSLLIASGATEEAVAVTAKAIDLGGGTSTLYHRLASLLLKLDQVDAALDAANSGLKLFPKNMGLLRTRRNLFEKKGHVDSALADAWAVVDAIPDNAADRMQLAGLLIAKKAYSEAMEHLEQVLKQKDDLLALRRERNSQELGRTHDALNVGNNIVSNAPESVSDFIRLAHLYAQINKFDLAVAILDRGVELAPDNVSLYRRKRNYLEQAGRLAEAIEAASVVTRLLPDSKLDAIRLNRLKVIRYPTVAKASTGKIYSAIQHRAMGIQALILNSEPFAFFPTFTTSVMGVLVGDEAAIVNSSTLLLNAARF